MKLFVDLFVCLKYNSIAERYSLASNFEKSLAGDKAKEILKNGRCIEDAKSVLENWLKN